MQNVFSVRMRKRASPLSAVLLEHCRDLGKRVEKVLKPTPKVLGRFISSASRSISTSSQLRNRSTHIVRESPSKLVLEELSSTTFATNLELNRASLELIILAKINMQFISNCLDKRQMCKGNLLFWKRSTI